MSPSLIYMLIIYPIIYILPAYVANGAPVIFGGGKPADLGRQFRGKRIFGDHKTLRGTFSCLAAGIIIASIESAFIPKLLLVGVLLTAGTAIGDLLGSFIKRQMGMKEGHNLAFFDQYFFLFVALAVALPAGYYPEWYGILFILLLTGILHRLTNILAHRANIKSVPW